MNENKNEEKEYNDIGSLAAYLHSDKMQAFKAAEKRSEMGLPPVDDDDDDEYYDERDEIDEILFSVSKKKKQKKSSGSHIFKSEYDDIIRGKSGGNEEKANTAKNDIPKNPITASAEKPKKRTGTQKSPDAPSAAGNAKQKIGSVITEAKNKLTPKKSENSEAAAEAKAQEKAPAVSGETKAPSKAAPKAAVKEPAKASAVTAVKETAAAKSGPAGEDNVPGLAASLSAALGEKASEIVRENRNSLPPEDTPETFDVEEGTEQEKEFDKTATRLMNAVNDPQERSVSMVDEVEAEEEDIREEKQRIAKLRLGYERQKQSTRTLAYILVALLLCAAILGCSAYASTYLVKWALDFTGVGSQEFKIDITVPDNADISTVAAILSENNIISDAKFFRMYADFMDKLKNNEDKRDFIAGKYTVSSTMSYSTLLSILRTKTNEIKTVNVRIVEGMTAHEIGALLEENNVCFAEDFEKYYKNIQNNYDFERRVKENPLKFCQLEGYLFPDTYEFYIVNAMEAGGKPGKNETAEEAYEKMKKESEENAKEAAKKMYSNFNEKMTRSMYKKMGEMNMTLDEIIALASIVQKEAGYAEDMEQVASVFLNRIRHSEEYPYLQSDVTVLYVENDIKPNIKGTDTAKQRIYNAYNTYVCQGIPAGAVCNPGLDAINAVLYAPDSPYFYFCANEETGEIYYAVTQEEHEQNLLLAQITPGEQGRDTPDGESETNE